MTRTGPHNGGFSVLEVLVALAVASAAVVALGAMSFLAIRVSNTVATSRSVHTALQDLQGVQQLLSESAATEVQQASATNFALVTGPAHDSVALGELNETSVILSGPAVSTHSDLTVFDQLALEYLERSDTTGPRWVLTPHLPGAVLGVRMTLRLGDRVWRPLLWLVPGRVS